MYKITLDFGEMLFTHFGVSGPLMLSASSVVNDAVRKAFQVKKVTSSHSKGRTEIISETELDADKLKTVIEASGYDVLDMKTEPYEKKGFSLFHRG